MHGAAGDLTGLGDQPRVLLGDVGRLGLDPGEVVAGLLLVRGLSVRDVEASLANALGAGGPVEVDRVSRVPGYR